MSNTSTEDILVVRWGQAFYVANESDAQDRDRCLAKALSVHSFEGTAAKSNTDAMRAFGEAKASCRRLAQ